MRNGMIYMRIRIDDLSFIGDSHTAERQFGMLSFKSRIVIITGYSVMQYDTIDQYVRSFPLTHEHRRNFRRILRRLLYIVVVEHSVVVHEYLANLRRQKFNGGLVRVIAHQQFGLRPFSYDNQQPAIHHKIDIAPKDIYQLYRFFHDDSVRNIQKEAVLGKSRVQGNGSVSFHIGDLSVITRYQIGVLQGHVTKATHQNAVREFR